MYSLFFEAWFIHRLYTFSENKGLAFICCLLSFLRFLLSMALSGIILRQFPVIDFSQKYWWLLMSIAITGTINDGLLAGSLSWYLNKSKRKTITRLVSNDLDMWYDWNSETSFRAAKSMLDQLIMWAVGRWLVCVIVPVVTHRIHTYRMILQKQVQ